MLTKINGLRIFSFRYCSNGGDYCFIHDLSKGQNYDDVGFAVLLSLPFISD